MHVCTALHTVDCFEHASDDAKGILIAAAWHRSRLLARAVPERRDSPARCMHTGSDGRRGSAVGLLPLGRHATTWRDGGDDYC
jgi:hypothetical protein